MSKNPAQPRPQAVDTAQGTTRRECLRHAAAGLGSLALGPLSLGPLALAQLAGGVEAAAATGPGRDSATQPRSPHAPPRVRNVIYLFMAGGPSQLELFGDKPALREYDGQPPPDSLTEGRRFAFLKPDAKLLGTRRKFARYGDCGMELSDLPPRYAYFHGPRPPRTP